jgi:maltooligosyltrehalose trehalohydrolase
VPNGSGVRFRVFATAGRDLGLQITTGRAAGTYELEPQGNGLFELFVPGAAAGDLYAYTLGDSEERPDPASRFQPQGVHGPSEVVDPTAYQWRQTGWKGADPRDLVIYELHVGTFTPEGTYAAAAEKLSELQALGVTAIELMPLADFAGSRNWGYDGASLFAPSHSYGRPDDLRALVDAAHGLGLAVILDVVYNHLGPEGAYVTLFHPDYITGRHHTPWGGAVNLDAPGSEVVRAFILDNAACWIREYRLDGLRLDATHALIDETGTHVVVDLAETVRALAPVPLTIHAEDHRNLASIVEPREKGGWGLDGIWADDFHHVVRRQLAGDAHGYYADFSGTCEELARTVRQGWLFTGQHSPHAGGARGTDSSSIPMHKFVVCLQNHDQVGNRARGERLHHQIEPAAWRAASTVLLTAPMTPLLFMGQEWAASTPFLYFTDLPSELGKLVTEGRRQEFASFPEFADPASRERIPDPQAPSTFEASRLKWDERETGVHGLTLALYRELLHLRRTHQALGASAALAGDAVAVDTGALVVRREGNGERLLIVTRLSGAGTVAHELAPWTGTPSILFTTEDPRFAAGPAAPGVDTGPGRIAVHFTRPGAVILKVA